MNTHDFGNRHKGDLNGKLSDPLANATVRVSAGRLFAQSVAGQRLLWMLVNLLARQYDVIARIVISVPDVRLREGIAPFGRSESLPDTLHSTAVLVANGTMSIVVECNEAASGEFASVECDGLPESRWSAAGDGWNATIAPTDVMVGSVSLSVNPIGPYFSACVLAGEVFKSIRGLEKARRHFELINVSLWDFVQTGGISPLKGPEIAGSLPDLYLVGAGAVGQGFLAVLLATEEVPGHVTIIDFDAIDEELTNLNRYALTTPDHRGQNKAFLGSEYFYGHAIKTYPFEGKWDDYIAAQKPNLPEHIRKEEARGRYGHLVSCVDTNPSRHALQRMWPRLIFGGSTDDLLAQVHRYDLDSEFECLMCSNPIDTQLWTVEGELARLQRLSEEERTVEAKRVGADFKLIESHLAAPRCGTLGEAELHKFRPASSPRQWSVGFVSVGAGIMLAAYVLRELMLGKRNDSRSSFRFSFESNRSRATPHRRRPDCACATEGQRLYRKLWS